MVYQLGAVVWVDLEGFRGHEQGWPKNGRGFRPCVVVSKASSDDMYIVVPCTATGRINPGDVAVKITKPSWARCRHARSVDLRAVSHRQSCEILNPRCHMYRNESVDREDLKEILQGVRDNIVDDASISP